MQILILSQEKKHVLQTCLSTLGTVTVQETPGPADICIVSNHPTQEQLNALGKTPIVLYVASDPFTQDTDAFLYAPVKQFASYSFILLPELYKSSKSYLETRYPTVPIHVIHPILDPYPNKVFSEKRAQTSSMNIVIRAKNTNFADNSWRQLCIAEQLYHMRPELIHDVYLFNAPTNRCAVGMYENLEIFKQKKLRIFIEFDAEQIVQHFNLEQNRSIYLMNSVSDAFDPLAFYCLQNQIGVVHTSAYMKQHSLGKFYNSYDIDGATQLLQDYASDPLDTTIINEFCKKFSETKVLLDAFKSVQKETLNYITSATYTPNDVSVPLVIGYDNTLQKNEQTYYFMESMKKNGWDYAVVSVSDEWNGSKDKIKGVARFLATLPDTKIVVISDTRDVVCCRTAKQFMDGFKSKQKDMIVSMELLCHGKFESDVRRGNSVPLKEFWKQNPPLTAPLRKFANSGLLCGKVSAVKKFYAWAATQDEALIGNYMNAFPSAVGADDAAELFHTSVFGYHDGLLSVQAQKQDSVTFAELFGRGAFFIKIPNVGDSGQKTMYKFVKTVLALGASTHLLQRKDYPEVDYFGNFADGSKLIIH